MRGLATHSEKRSSAIRRYKRIGVSAPFKIDDRQTPFGRKQNKLAGYLSFNTLIFQGYFLSGGSGGGIAGLVNCRCFIGVHNGQRPRDYRSARLKYIGILGRTAWFGVSHRLSGAQ